MDSRAQIGKLGSRISEGSTRNTSLIRNHLELTWSTEHRLHVYGSAYVLGAWWLLHPTFSELEHL